MFKDIEMAREENASYRSMREERQQASSVDLTVNVLSSSAWPSYPDVRILSRWFLFDTLRISKKFLCSREEPVFSSTTH